jgi:hypothetical protein
MKLPGACKANIILKVDSNNYEICFLTKFDFKFYYGNVRVTLMYFIAEARVGMHRRTSIRLSIGFTKSVYKLRLQYCGFIGSGMLVQF